jgi:hypothetical protein
LVNIQLTLHGREEQLSLWKAQPASAGCSELLQGGDGDASDLVPGVYEGGLKLWEGAIDLAIVLASTYRCFPEAAADDDCQDASTDSAAQKASEALAGQQLADLKGARVLELGCGHGLPGVLALLGGAAVTFHVRRYALAATLTACWRAQVKGCALLLTH